MSATETELPVDGKPMGQVTDSEALSVFLDSLSQMRRDEFSDAALEEHIHQIGLAVPVIGRLIKIFREAIDDYVHKHGAIAKDDTHDWAITPVVKKDVKMTAFADTLDKSVEANAASGVTLKSKLAQIPLKPSQAEKLLGAPLPKELVREYEEDRLKAVKNANPGRLDDAAKQFLGTPLLEVDIVAPEEVAETDEEASDAG